MIKKGKEDAETLSNLLPIFQKKIKDPSKIACAIKTTQKFDYSNRN